MIHFRGFIGADTKVTVFRQYQKIMGGEKVQGSNCR